MQFLIDAQLPPSLFQIFFNLWHSAVHTSNFPKGNTTTDNEIIVYAKKHSMLIITKDSDFYHSHILHNQPKKLLLVKTGNFSLKEVKLLFEKNLKTIIHCFEKHNLVELHKD